MEVRVTIGVYSDLNKAHIYKINIPQLPQIGDTIILTDELKKEEAMMKKMWGLTFDMPFNCVRAITYDAGSTPIVMLSFSPALILMYCYKGNDFLFSMCNRVVPRVGECVMSSQGVTYYVENISYCGAAVFLYLSDNAVSQDVYVVNSELDVNISNTSCQLDVAIDDRHPIDVNVTNYSLSVNMADRY